jgi:UDP-glucose 4-epimerase
MRPAVIAADRLRAVAHLPVDPPLILVTGGTGYIGSHTCVCLQSAGYEVLVVDDLSNSEVAVLGAIAAISGKAPLFERADVRDQRTMESIVDRYRPVAAIHFAGVKSVSESVRDPIKYYDVNVAGSLSLLAAMSRAGPPCMVFSSSATVYGEPDELPLQETHPLRPQSAYGRSKMAVELILADVCTADCSASAVALRYFNPVGAHPDGGLGESPRGLPENLMPHLGRVASGKSPLLSVFGDDYPTLDGTCVRDYVHVMDLAEAHVAALRLSLQSTGLRIINIGTGEGVSVMALVRAYAAACGHPLAYDVVARRAGDVACYYADTRMAANLLGWTASRGIGEMCADSWRFVCREPIAAGAALSGSAAH